MKIFNTYRVIILIAILFLVVIESSLYIKSQKSDKEFKNWVASYKKDVKKNFGFSDSFLDETFNGIKLNQDVLKAEKSQPEVKLSRDEYIAYHNTPSVIASSQLYLKDNVDVLKTAEKQYKIPFSIIVALNADGGTIESQKYSYNTLESLTALAYAGSRKTLFRTELNSYLALLNKKYLFSNNKSSWAGAIGKLQFMPSNYLLYAVDGNSDYHIDLYNSSPDIIYSTANLLRTIGWDFNKKWGYEIVVPDDLKKDISNYQGTVRPIFVWKNLGIKTVQGKELPNSVYDVKLVVTESNRVFLVTSNFDSLMGWNKSISYALAIGILSDNIHDYALANSLLLEEKEKVEVVKTEPSKKESVKKHVSSKKKIKHKKAKKHSIHKKKLAKKATAHKAKPVKPVESENKIENQNSNVNIDICVLPNYSAKDKTDYNKDWLFNNMVKILEGTTIQ